MAKKKGTDVVFTRSIAGGDFSYRKGEKARIDPQWARALAAGGTVRILSEDGKSEKAVMNPQTPEE